MQTISKWGDSLALLIPAASAEKVGLREGTAVDLKVQAGRLIVIPIQCDLQQLVARITRKSKHKLFDWGRPVGNEVW